VDTAPDAMVKSTVDEVLAVIKQNKDKQAMRQLASKRCCRILISQAMHASSGHGVASGKPGAATGVGKHFRTLLVNTYTSQ